MESGIFKNPKPCNGVEIGNSHNVEVVLGARGLGGVAGGDGRRLGGFGFGFGVRGWERRTGIFIFYFERKLCNDQIDLALFEKIIKIFISGDN